MKQSKVFLITLLFAVGFGFSECDNCSCPEIDGTHFNILGVKNLEHLGNINGEETTVSEGEAVDFEDYRGVNLTFNSEFTFSQKNQKSAPFNFSLMNTAYGCSCSFNGINGSLQEITALDIITMNDFDSTHLANDTINEYFLTELYDGTIEEFLGSNQEKNLYPTSFDGSIEDDLELPLLLNQQPSLDSTFQVKVNIEFDNGAVYTVETDEITIR